LGRQWVDNVERERLSLRISKSRLEKLRRIAEQREKTMTQLVEDWIDKLKEEKPS
jgi:predicted DNA-binding ribbon-helix-helix protein